MFSKQPSLNKFPESFHFGVATADHQFEAYEPEYEDVTDVWERASNKQRRGRATDFSRRYREDIALAKSLGCTMFRFSISWSRIEPRQGEYNEAAFEYYRDMIAACREAGMEPVVTILHFAWPVHVEARGGLISPDFPKIFEEYVTELAKRFAKDVKYWIPFNEPTLLTAGYVSVSGKTGYNLPPGMPEGATITEQLEAIADLIRNVFLAHTAARKVLKQFNPDAQVGCNPHILGLPAWLQNFLDRNATKLRSRHEQIRNARRYVTRPLLEKGRVDVVLATLTHTDEREQEIAFSDTYFVAGQTLLVKADSGITGKDDLNGKPVAVVSTSTSHQALTRLIPQALPRVLGTYEQALAEIDQGQAAAILADNVILESFVVRYPGRYKLLGDMLTHEPYAAAVARGNQDVLDIINITLQQLKDSGELATLYGKHIPGGEGLEIPVGRTQALAAMRGRNVLQKKAEYIGLQDNKPLPKANKGTLLRHIQDRGYLVVAVKTDVPGFGYYDPATKEFSGLEIDLARAIAKTIFGDPTKVRFEPALTQERIPLLRSLIRFLDPLINLYNIFTTWINANWWHLGMAGKLPEFMCPKECIGQQDFIGFDYYWGISSFRPDRLLSLFRAFVLGRNLLVAPVWPSALYDILQYSTRMFPGMPIMVVENGCVESAQGVPRADYLREHIRQVQRAVSEGMNIIGYLCWSLTSNREWGLKFNGASDFGLYYIDLDNDPDLKRVPTPSVDTYLKIISQRSVE